MSMFLNIFPGYCIHVLIITEIHFYWRGVCGWQVARMWLAGLLYSCGDGMSMFLNIFPGYCIHVLIKLQKSIFIGEV